MTNCEVIIQNRLVPIPRFIPFIFGIYENGCSETINAIAPITEHTTSPVTGQKPERPINGIIPMRDQNSTMHEIKFVDNVSSEKIS